jgi:hypothetical protein
MVSSDLKLHSRTLVAAGPSVAFTVGKATVVISHPVLATKKLPLGASFWVVAGGTLTD